MTRTVTDDLYKSYGASAIYFTVGLDKDGRLTRLHRSETLQFAGFVNGKNCGSFRFLVARQKLLDAHTSAVFAVTVDHDKASLAEALGFGAMLGGAGPASSMILFAGASDRRWLVPRNRWHGRLSGRRTRPPRHAEEIEGGPGLLGSSRSRRERRALWGRRCGRTWRRRRRRKESRAVIKFRRPTPSTRCSCVCLTHWLISTLEKSIKGLKKDAAAKLKRERMTAKQWGLLIGCPRQRAAAVCRRANTRGL